MKYWRSEKRASAWKLRNNFVDYINILIDYIEHWSGSRYFDYLYYLFVSHSQSLLNLEAYRPWLGKLKNLAKLFTYLVLELVPIYQPTWMQKLSGSTTTR